MVMQDGVEGDEYPRSKVMGKRHKLGNLDHAIAGIVPRTKAGATQINGIRPM